LSAACAVAIDSAANAKDSANSNLIMTSSRSCMITTPTVAVADLVSQGEVLGPVEGSDEVSFRQDDEAIYRP